MKFWLSRFILIGLTIVIVLIALSLAMQRYL